MKNKRELSNFLANSIAEEFNLDETPYDFILGLLVEFEEIKDKDAKGRKNDE